jgi:sugar lactone lactonase YvrE
MNKAGIITKVSPRYAVSGGEIALQCDGFTVDGGGSHACYIGGEPCTLVAASRRRVLAIVPEDVEGDTVVNLESEGEGSPAAEITVGRLLADDMHIVANPAVDPKDDSIILTRSGSRGQQLPNTLYRLEPDGYLDEFPVEIMNPTGIAFDHDGDLYATNRADGEVCRIERGEQAVPYATGLGTATGIAFNEEGVMFVGDRAGTIHRIDGPGRSVPFATLEPSVAAFHLAFGPDGRLYVSSPGLASHDSVWAIDRGGSVRSYFRGFGRPQGLAFDRDGNLYIAACYQGHHGIVRVSKGGKSAENFVAVNNAVGLCFTRRGEMIIATTDAAYSLPVDIYGTLLN